MDLTANPFYRLGATIEDDRRRIAELAEEQSLVGDETSIREARRVLTNPRKRLAAEVGWLPGLRPKRAAEAISVLDVNPADIRRFTDVPALARANLLAEGLVRLGVSLAGKDIADWIVEISATHERLQVEEIVELLNEARIDAGFPTISRRESVEEEMQGRRRHFRDAIKRSLDQLPATTLVDTVTLAVDQATTNGTVHAPILIDDLVDTYEMEAQVFLKNESENVKTLVQQIRDAASKAADEEKIDALVTMLESVVKNWDYVAQPIQVSFRSRGLSHSLSHEVAGEIRKLAVDLYNEHSLLDVSQRLTSIQKSVFVEIAKITEQLDEDAARLDDLTEWRREITYEVNVGLMQKKFRISPDGVHWRGSTIGLEEITWMRWDGNKQSMTVGGKRTSVHVVFSRSTFTEVFERLWKTVGVRLLTEMLKGLKAGQRYQFGTAIVGDYGVVLERRRIFGPNESVSCQWTDLQISNGAGTFCIVKSNERKVYVELFYSEVNNVHIIEAAIRALWKRGNRNRRMSDLLEET